MQNESNKQPTEEILRAKKKGTDQQKPIARKF